MGFCCIQTYGGWNCMQTYGGWNLQFFTRVSTDEKAYPREIFAPPNNLLPSYHVQSYPHTQREKNQKGEAGGYLVRFRNSPPPHPHQKPLTAQIFRSFLFWPSPLPRLFCVLIFVELETPSGSCDRIET